MKVLQGMVEFLFWYVLLMTSFMNFVIIFCKPCTNASWSGCSWACHWHFCFLIKVVCLYSLGFLSGFIKQNSVLRLRPSVIIFARTKAFSVCKYFYKMLMFTRAMCWNLPKLKVSTQTIGITLYLVWLNHNYLSISEYMKIFCSFVLHIYIAAGAHMC